MYHQNPRSREGRNCAGQEVPRADDPAVGVKNTEGHCSTRTQAGSIQNAKEKPDESSTQSSKEQKQEFVTDFSAERLETRRWCRVAFQGRKCTQSWISTPSDIDLRREDRMERWLNHQARLLSSGTELSSQHMSGGSEPPGTPAQGIQYSFLGAALHGSSLTRSTHKHITKNSSLNV